MNVATTWRDDIPNIRHAAQSLGKEAADHPKDSQLKSEAGTLGEELLDILQNLEQLMVRSPKPPPLSVDRAKDAAAEAEKQAKRAEDAAERAEKAAKRALSATDPLDKEEAARTARDASNEARRAATRAKEEVDEGEGGPP